MSLGDWVPCSRAGAAGAFGRTAAAVALLAAGAALAPALADDTLVLGGFTGSFETTMRKAIIPTFEAAHPGIKVQYVAGNSVELLAKLMAQKGSGQGMDVVVLDDGPMYQALALGLCGTVAPSEEVSQLYPNANRWGGHAVGMGMLAAGLAYNEKIFEDNHWPAPTSWADLTDPRYKGRLLGISLTSAFGLYSLIMTARVNGGGEDDIEPGFAAIRTRMKPNVVAWQSNSGQISALFQSGDVAIAPWSTGRVKALADGGLPVKFVYPKEGAVELMETVCPVAGTKVETAAQAFIRHLLSPDAQAKMAESEGYGPTTRNTVLPKALAEGVPYGPDALAHLVQIKWDTVNQQRADWIARWGREIER